MANTAPVIVWFRQDLRLEDNPAIADALALEVPILPVFCWSPASEGPWPAGAASRWWLHHALTDLDAQLRALGSALHVYTEDPIQCLPRLAESLGAQAVLCNRRMEPVARDHEQRLAEALAPTQTRFVARNGSMLFPPEVIANQSGTPFKVFTAFWKHCLRLGLPQAQVYTVSSFAHCPAVSSEFTPSAIPDLGLLPTLNWDAGFYTHWTPAVSAGQAMLEAFTHGAAKDYVSQRDLPAVAGTSRMAPYLHWGQISPRQVVSAFLGHSGPGPETYLKELGWREFSYHLLSHFPHTESRPMRPEFEAFPWAQSDALLSAWQRGQTGYPIVDAGMRELWHTGWMHNRVRMIVASFLVKDLLIPWQAGAQWFWDTLVDADLASNTQGWQWTAGCGADAAPYFRVFNPVLQGEKFDAKGDYVRRWCPELSQVPSPWIHKPWQAPPLMLASYGVTLGQTYPHPIVNHSEARDKALLAFKALKPTVPSSG